MTDIVTMPKLGFDMQEGTLVRWVKGEGEEVSKGEVLAEIETDKATVEVESQFSGVLFKHLVEKDSIVPVGTPIAVIAQAGESPDLSDFEKADVHEGKEEPASPEAPVREMPSEAGPKDVEPEAEAKPAVAEAASIEEQEIELPTGDGRLRASPLAKRLAEERGINLAQIKGSGPGGRIVRKDVETAAQKPPMAVVPQEPVQAVAPAQKTAKQVVSIPQAVWGQIGQPPANEEIKLSRLRSIIGRRMTESRQTVPHFYVTHDYDVEKLLKLRSELNDLLSDEQKLSVNDFVVKAVAYALRQFPNLNARLNEDAIIRLGQVNIGVAVAVENGLMTIVVKDADQKPLRLISQEIKDMAARARDGRVRPEDIEGSSFSISNLGMFDVDHFVAIINPPESAIIAVASARETPVVENGEVRVGQRMRLTLSADHRVTDGAEAARFMQVLAEFLEEPFRLMV